jgi:hypothetical protein
MCTWIRRRAKARDHRASAAVGGMASEWNCIGMIRPCTLPSYARVDRLLWKAYRRSLITRGRALFTFRPFPPHLPSFQTSTHVGSPSFASPSSLLSSTYSRRTYHTSCHPPDPSPPPKPPSPAFHPNPLNPFFLSQQTASSPDSPRPTRRRPSRPPPYL